MSEVDEKFFNENVVKVNKMIMTILLLTALVPIHFIILTLQGIWIVPHPYSCCILFFSLISYGILKVFSVKNIYQSFSMYFGLLATLVFVSLLAYKDVINISICYAFPAFMSCLYYNRKLSISILIVTHITLFFILLYQSQNIIITNPFYESRMHWFVSHFIGVTIEFIFLFILVIFMSARTRKTLQDLVVTSEERNSAVEKLLHKIGEVQILNKELEKKNNELEETQYDIIRFIAQCLGSHDLFTGRHVIHTQKYVEVICNELVKEGYYTDILTEKTIQTYKSAAFLHDVGKLHIPEGILNKVGRFTPEEFQIMKCHAEEGRKLLAFLPPIDNCFFNQIAEDMAYYHHEKWDGSGYPCGLEKTQIPLVARIMAAADVLDALISRRLYKEPMSIDQAMDVFKKSRGSHFEECIADCVINSRDIIDLIDTNFKSIEETSNNEELKWWLRYHESQKT